MIEAVVPAALDGERADRVVAIVTGLSRQSARELFESGVSSGGRRLRPQDRLAAGAGLSIPDPGEGDLLVPEAAPLTVVHEDADLLVIDKPPGVVVHPGSGHKAGTLAARILAAYPEVEGVGTAGRWGLVHRLDRDTSGLMAVARTQPAYEALTADLAARRVRRTYLALVHGVPSPPTGTIDAPIRRQAGQPARREVGSGGKAARTHFRVVEDLGAMALLEVELETGRTHQIRVHLAAIGHDVVGDRTYGRVGDVSPRLFLHAARLRLPHPISRAEVDLSSPLPPDLAETLERLRRGSEGAPLP
jgi:23S rRNA pseudouridine1911/1915/1917 synthase